MVSTKAMTNASSVPGAERKDKHVRDRVETKETMRGLHGVVWIESLIIIARKTAVPQFWPLAAEARYEDPVIGHTAPVLSRR